MNMKNLERNIHINRLMTNLLNKGSLRSILVLALLLVVGCSPTESELEGCTHSEACNFDEFAETDDDSCWYASPGFSCGSNENVDDGDGGDTGGGTTGGDGGTTGGDDTDECVDELGGSVVEDCAGECGGDAEVDECGVCDGDGIDDGFCDCDGNVDDCAGECGGDAEVDDCGICNGDGTTCSAYIEVNVVVEDCSICNEVTGDSSGDILAHCTGCSEIGIYYYIQNIGLSNANNVNARFKVEYTPITNIVNPGQFVHSNMLYFGTISPNEIVSGFIQMVEIFQFNESFATYNDVNVSLMTLSYSD